MSEMDNRIARLPIWARQYINQLRQKAAPMNQEVQFCRAQVEAAKERERKMRERCEVMTELMTCAARGGHETAQAYVDRIISEYISEEVK